MVLSTMKAKSTRMLPPTVRTMQTPIKSAMRKLCQGSKVGRTGVSSVSPAVVERLPKRESVELAREELYHSTTPES